MIEHLAPRIRRRSLLLAASGVGITALAGCSTQSGSTPTATVPPSPTVVAAIPTAPDRPRPVTSPVTAPHITPPPSPVASPAASPAATPAGSHSLAQPVTAIPDTQEQALSAELVGNEVGIYGVVVLESDGSVVVSINGTTPFITASTYKVVVIADILNRVEQGEYALDDYFELTDYNHGGGLDNYWSYDQVGASFPLEEYLIGVAVYSSNASAHTLLDLTSVESLNATAQAIGMDRTVLFATMEDLPWWPPKPAIDSTHEEMDAAIAYLENEFSLGPVNISTPLDMARYNLAIVHDTLISPWVSGQVADLLMANAIRDRIPALLDGDLLTLDKPGNLEDAVNDVGVIFLESGPRPLALMAMGVPDEDWTTWIEQRLAYVAAGYSDYPPMPYGNWEEVPDDSGGDSQWEDDEEQYPADDGSGG